MTKLFIKTVILGIFVVLSGTLLLASERALAGSWGGSPLEDDAIHPCIDTTTNPVTGLTTSVVWRHTGPVEYVVNHYPGFPLPMDMALLDFVTHEDTGNKVPSGTACVATTTQPFPWLYFTRDPETCIGGWAWCVAVQPL